jgi:hypothetical protein
MPRSSFIARRIALHFLAPLALALMLVLQVQNASAGIGWCRTDPLITVDGHSGHVYIESTEQMFSSATGPILIEVRIPVGTSASAVPLDYGFGRGYAITFKEDDRLYSRGSYVEVRVRANVPAIDGSLPVKVTFHSVDQVQQDSIKSGTANDWIETGTVRL